MLNMLFNIVTFAGLASICVNAQNPTVGIPTPRTRSLAIPAVPSSSPGFIGSIQQSANHFVSSMTAGQYGASSIGVANSIISGTPIGVKGPQSFATITTAPATKASVSFVSPPETVTKQLVPPASHFQHFDCGTNAAHASDEFLNTAHDLHQSSLDAAVSKSSGSAARRLVARTTSNFNVPLYIHIVTTKANAGTVSKQQVTQQVAALNSAYKSHGITFTLMGSDWTVNDAWAIGATSNDDMAMKSALRQGTYGALNLYMQSDLANGILGKCTLPTDIGSNPTTQTYAVDGCNIAAGTMPNGPIGGYNMGMTAVHETGHWLGLLHTFEGYSCTGSGDMISDTPAESSSTNGCPTNPWKNTCPQRPGVDPIHNFMDYSTDACYVRFTAGQELRMKQMWPQFRQGK